MPDFVALYVGYMGRGMKASPELTVMNIAGREGKQMWHDGASNE
jgi:hypothetical protein